MANEKQTLKKEKQIKVYNKKKTRREYERVSDVRDLCRVLQKK